MTEQSGGMDSVSGRTNRRNPVQEVKLKNVKLFVRCHIARKLRSFKWNLGLTFKKLYSFIASMMAPIILEMRSLIMSILAIASLIIMFLNRN